MNCLSRAIAGLLLDRMKFSLLMPTILILLTLVLLSIFFIAQESLTGLVASIWIIYALSFANFSAVPAQVKIIHQIIEF